MARQTAIPESPAAAPRLSRMADGLVGSEILKIAADIRAMTAAGRRVCNLTVGDFNATHFPVPDELRTGIEAALRAGETNYPPSDGIPALRAAVQAFYAERLGLEFPREWIIITGGARPAIYATYASVVDPGDTVIYSVPSWNNNHYCHMSGARGVAVPCTQEGAFLPTRADLEPYVREARLLALSSPLNPAGTAFGESQLAEICELVLEENERREGRERPLYVMYDQVYWMLTFGDVRHVDPVRVCPDMRRFTLYVDGISKCFASTGLRVGWTVAPGDLVPRMSNLLGHVGAWAPRPEQVASAALLTDHAAVDRFAARMHAGVQERLRRLYDGLQRMRAAGLPVDAIAPMGAIYLSARFSLRGMRTPDGTFLTTDELVRRYLLDAAALAVVPFQAFGCTEDDGWFRLSVGAVGLPEIDEMFPRLEAALAALQAA